MQFKLVFYIVLSIAGLHACVVAQEVTVCGRLLGNDGEPLGSSTVKIKRGLRRQTISTDTAGRFCIGGLRANDTLEFSQTGYSRGRYAVSVSSEIELQLKRQTYRVTISSGRVFLGLPLPAPVEWDLRINKAIEGSPPQASENFDVPGGFTWVEIAPAYYGSPEKLAEELTSGIKTNERQKAPGLLILGILIAKDSIRSARTVSGYSSADEEVRKRLERTEDWVGPIQNGNWNSAYCELKFTAEIKNHKLLLVLKSDGQW